MRIITIFSSFIILIILMVVKPVSLNSVGNFPVIYPDLFVTPVNQRITNELSDFEYSPYIDAQIERFMTRSELNGVSVAIIDQERLVFSRSYGYANREEGITATPEHLFRVASVSKLITSIAVMKLVEDGLLNLSDPVFGENGFFNEEQYLDIRDPKLRDITIQNLLNHTSGWSQIYGDPAFNPLLIARLMEAEPPATLDTYLKFVVSRRLHYTPGTIFSYSNIAYMFLGAIIEKVTGKKYEDFVRYQILFPNGIFDMYLAKNHFEDKYFNEVKYYEHDGTQKILSSNGDSVYVSKIYGGNDIELLGAAGGWVASAPELAKLMTLIDGFDKVPDLLLPATIDMMTNNLSPMGWSETSGGKWNRTGNFSGTVAMLHRSPDGLQWVFLSNTSNWQGPRFYEEINRTMQRLTKKVIRWPNHDLFNYFEPATLSFLPIPVNDDWHPVN